MKYVFSICFVLLLGLSAASASAFSLTDPISTQYVPLVPIPGITDTSSTGGDIGTYIQRSYVLVISLSITLAVVMFIIHAFSYMTSEANIGNIANAKKGMKNVAIGLVLLLSAYLILQTINPALVSFQLGDVKVPVAGIPPAQNLDDSNCEDVTNRYQPDIPGTYVVRVITCNNQTRSYYQIYTGTLAGCRTAVQSARETGEAVDCVFFGSSSSRVSGEPCEDVARLPSVPTPTRTGVYAVMRQPCRQSDGSQSQVLYHMRTFGQTLEQCQDRWRGTANFVNCIEV